MKRRQFITLASVAALGSSTLPSLALPATQRARWRPDGAGSVARIGVLTPDFDPVPESEMWAMTQPGVSIHSARVTWKWNDDPKLFAESPQVDTATEQLVSLKPQVIVYAFTSSSYALGAEADGTIRARLEKRGGGVPVVLTCQAATEALRVVEAHRIALVHPPWFSEEVSAKGRDYFRKQGFEVLSCARITPWRAFTEVLPAEVYEWVRSNVPSQAEAVLIGGNGLRAIGVIEALEEDLRKPVLTANQVAFWQALRVVGAASKMTEYGSLFGKGASR